MSRNIEYMNPLRRLLCALLGAGLLAAALFTAEAEAKIYIDVTNPRQQIIVAVSEFTGPVGAEVSDIITADLSFTGFFVPLGREAFIEDPNDRFGVENWGPLGAELVVKGRIRVSATSMSIVVRLYDVYSGREVFKKLYRAKRNLIRPLAHGIANDIYRKVTGRDGVFRSKIAFVTRDGGRDELNIMDYDGMRRNSLGVRAGAILSPHWSDNGRKLIYSAERRRKWNINVLDIKHNKEKMVYNAIGTNIVGDFFPGGNEFAFSSSKEGTPDIFTYDISRKRLMRLTTTKGIEVSPAVSPNGRTLAFVSDRGGNPQIYTVDKIGYNISRITYKGSYNTSPAWSPKGDRLAYSGRYMGKNQIYTVRPNGSGLMMLTVMGNNEAPSFSPDGRYLTFISDRDGRKGVYIMRANGEAQKRITPRAITATGSRWSPK